MAPSTMALAPIPVVQAQSYATQKNAQYKNEATIFVDLDKRLKDAIANLPHFRAIGLRGNLSSACKSWMEKFSHVKEFSDLNLVKTLTVPLSDILIDITMQRKLDLAWVILILMKFREVQAQPLQVYQVVDTTGDLGYYPTGDSLYASWDAQHTGVVFYIIAVWILKLDPTKVMVPVNIYPVKMKSEIRQNFVSTNSVDGKKLLEDIDLFMQMVFGVRLDGNDNPTWKEAEIKQQYLEQADLFVTNEKFADTDQPGAISRMQEINHYSPDIIRKFCLYSSTIPVPRPIASQEIEILCKFFDLAKKAGIDYTDQEVLDIGNHLHLLFDSNFHESSPFWEKVRTAYMNWWDDFYRGVVEDRRPSNPRLSKNQNTGIPFLWHQMRKTLPAMRLPRMPASSFIPAAKDLY
jgi:hypothetical protein